MKLFPLDSFPPEKSLAINDQGNILTYGELSRLSLRLSETVSSRSIALVLVKNTLGCVGAVVNLMNHGVVLILVDANASSATVQLHIDRYQPQFLVVPTASNEHYSLNTQLLNILDYSVLELARQQTNYNLPHPDLALLLSTSGSTGSPKLVRQSYLNLVSNAEAIASYLNIDQSDRPITSLPLHYTYGFSVLSSHLMAGATLLVTDCSLMERAFWRFFDEAGTTSLAGVPYTYQMLQQLGFLRRNSGTLRTLTQAGGKLNPSLIRDFSEYAIQRDIEFYVMYGQTEATARMSYVPPERTLEKIGSIGIAIPGGELFLADSEGIEITSPNVQGELGYRGQNVAMGYAEQRSDLSKGDERHGKLLTGDLALRDTDGYYYITGRLNRFAKLFGKRVSLDDLEQICLSLVTEVACTSADDQVTIWITEEQHQYALTRMVATHTAIHASAYQVRVIDHLPRTSAGKIDYPSLIGRST